MSNKLVKEVEVKHTIKVNGIEFGFDASDSDCMEKFEIAIEKMDEQEKALNKRYEAKEIKHYEFLKGYCKLLADFFINTTDTDVLKGVTSVDKATDFYYDFLRQVKEAGVRTKNNIAKYDPKRIK